MSVRACVRACVCVRACACVRVRACVRAYSFSRRFVLIAFCSLLCNGLCTPVWRLK